MLAFDGKAVGPWFVFSFTPVNPFSPDYVYPTYLFATQGSADTTGEVVGAYPPDLRRTGSRFGSLGSCVYFCRGDRLHGQELWRVCPPLPYTPRRHLADTR